MGARFKQKYRLRRDGLYNDMVGGNTDKNASFIYDGDVISMIRSPFMRVIGERGCIENTFHKRNNVYG